jgi:hypothetical protein
MPGLPRLVAVGDVHGELEGFQEILLAENLINSEKNWSGTRDVLLQIGDMVDRGPFSLESVAYLRQLQKQAEIAGGQVIRLLGNHELLVLQEVYYYCNYPNPESLGQELRREILSGKIQAAFVWEKRLYIHAGIRMGILDRVSKDIPVKDKSWESHYEDLAVYLNRVVQESVRNNDYSGPLFWVDASRGGRDPVGGIFWSHYPDLELEDENPIRQAVGHTPAFRHAKGIRWSPDRNKINLDAGLYSGYGGTRAWLLVEGGHLYAKRLTKGKVVCETIE